MFISKVTVYLLGIISISLGRTIDYGDEKVWEKFLNERDQDPDHPDIRVVAPTPHEFQQRVQQEGFRRGDGPEYWRNMAQESLRESLKAQQLNRNVAKNVIIFIGDGFGVTTGTATRIFEGNQIYGKHGEEHYLSFEKFPFLAQAKVYNSDWQAPDSAGTSTAMLCGIKCPFSTMAVDDHVVQFFCPSQPGNEVDCITDWAQEAGKSTGVVTNTDITHATPAAAYANSVSRLYQSDNMVPPFWRELCPDIARQLIERAADINVVMGGSRARFMGSNLTDPITGEQGFRVDQRNLIEEWAQHKIDKGLSHAIPFTRDELLNISPEDTDYILGLFTRSGHMEYEDSRESDQPSLNEMVSKAVDVLKKNPNGFVLVVEGGRIDHAHHATQAHRAFIETQMFAKAVQTAVDKTSEEDTLIIVTADHSHVMSFGGYHFKGTDPLATGIQMAADLMPYTKLTYGNGPGWAHDEQGNRENLFGFNPTADPEYQQQTAVPLGLETHSGEDVPIYARGPMAHLFQGLKEQHFTAHAAAYAACIGANLDHCGGSHYKP